MILPIIKAPNQILLNKSENISSEYPELLELIKNMYETCKSNNGVGLAAPQIGLNINLFVVMYENVQKAFINPKIKESTDTILITEGCLSVPNKFRLIPRGSKIEISYFDENFNNHVDKYDGFIARICLHEYDHLIGKLI